MSRKKHVIQYPYPPCPLTELYPLLQRIPVEDRSAYVVLAEAGVELTAEQNAALGFHPSLTGGVLLPVDMSKATTAQLNSLIGGDRRVLGDILRLGISQEASA